ncbi:MAG TPA: PQQ-binding-like beta-propeller repeat protein [Candidatus Baltobacteraceae bacterium]|nr:PQQ-binding-like beta-propeller repeat protein [Candidatus Baltobacteraceae bacterium]
MRNVTLSLIFAILAACAPHKPDAATFVPSGDPRVNLFRSDVETAWPQFRLGGGLNVVVANPQLPAEPAWRVETNGQYSSSPSVSGSTVLMANNNGKLYALDARTGANVWTASADNEIMSQPVYASGTVYVGVGNSLVRIWAAPQYKLMGTGANDLLALTLAKGEPVWRAELPGSGMPTPALVGPMLVHGNGAGLVYAFRAADGGYLWHSYAGSDMDMSQMLDGADGRIYIGGSYPNAVLALDARSGAVVWRHRFATYDGALSDCPLATNGQDIYGMYVRQVAPMRLPFRPDGRNADQHVFALDAKSGSLRWDVLLPGVRGIVPRFNEAAIPLLYGGTLYDGSALAPVVSALDTKTGVMRWQLRVGGPVKGGIAARDDVLYFGDLAGYLWAVDARNGRPIGKIQAGTPFNVGSPIILNDSLVIGSRDGAVLAVPLRAIRQSNETYTR